jgi:hypothetical protein
MNLNWSTQAERVRAIRLSVPASVTDNLLQEHKLDLARLEDTVRRGDYDYAEAFKPSLDTVVTAMTNPASFYMILQYTVAEILKEAGREPGDWPPALNL